ncbi:MAG: glycosyltransferase family 4 protein [Muribaculaceae bacterium]
MKILLLSTGGKTGGEETFTRNLALNLQKKGHYVEVAVGGDIQQLDLDAYNIKIAPIDITKRNVWGLFNCAKALAKYIKTNHFDIIHAQAIGPAIMGVLAKKIWRCQTPWIWHNHGITDFAYKYIVKYFNRLDLVIANSDYVGVMLRRYGISLSKCKRIHNGITVADFAVTDQDRDVLKSAKRVEFGFKSTDKIVIYVGRLSPEKGVEVLLRAFEAVYADRTDIQCLLIGDGVQKAALESQISNYNSKQHIVFAGFRKDIKELVAASDILVLPSHMETFSLTTLQAFATGTPCIASDVGGTPEQILNDFNGFLFRDNDDEDLALKIKVLIEDSNKYNYFRHNAKALSESYLNGGRMTDEIEQVYKSLIEQ